MLSLPPALAPWAAHLDLFPTELALALGPLIRRLAAGIGTLPVATHSGLGEPDGYDGLTRRGSVERLLLSEWLLADALPDEFLRRAAMNELAFLRPVQTEPHGERVCVALFDAGPEQLGSPRLAHLAALIVLARRAEAAGVRFAWETLTPDPNRDQLYERPFGNEGVTKENIRLLLTARTCLPTEDATIAQWRERVTRQLGKGELWLIGNEALRRFPATRDLALLTITPDRESATLDAQLPSGQRVTLPLPEGALCARLLRDPFAAAPGESRKVPALVPGSNLVFSENGTKVYTRTPNGRKLIAYPIPNSPRAPVGKPRLYEPQPLEAVIGVGRWGRTTVLVTQTNDQKQLRVTTFGDRPETVPVGRFALPPNLTIVDELHFCAFARNGDDQTVTMGSYRLTQNHSGERTVGELELPEAPPAHLDGVATAFDEVLLGKSYWEGREVLVVLSAGRRLLRLRYPGGEHTLPSPGSRIVHATLHEGTGRLAYATELGELFVWHIPEYGPLARFLPETDDQLTAPNEGKPSLHDPLTGLLGKRGAEDLLQYHCQRAEQRAATFGVLLGRLRELSTYQTQHGFRVADGWVKASADALRQQMRGFGIVCRLAAGDFLVVAPDCTATELQVRFRQARERAVELARFRIVTVEYPTDAKDASALLTRLDEELYHAQEAE